MIWEWVMFYFLTRVVVICIYLVEKKSAAHLDLFCLPFFNVIQNLFIFMIIFVYHKTVLLGQC